MSAEIIDFQVYKATGRKVCPYQYSQAMQYVMDNRERELARDAKICQVVSRAAEIAELTKSGAFEHV